MTSPVVRWLLASLCLALKVTLTTAVYEGTGGKEYAVTTYNNTYDLVNVTDWDVSAYPDPRRDVDACGQDGRQSFVCDPNNLLEPETAIYLDTIIEELMDLKCPCEILGQPCPKGRAGYHIGIALVSNLKLADGVPDSEIERDLEIQRFTIYLRTRKWHLGFCNNDAVVTVVASQGKVYTSTGSIAKNTLTNECVHLAEEKAQGFFAEGNFSAGLIVMLNEFSTFFSEGAKCTIQGPKLTEWPIEAILGVIIGMLAFMIVCVVTLTRFCSGAGASGPSSRTHYYTSYRENRNSMKKGAPVHNITAIEEEMEMIPINEVKQVDI